MIRVPIAREREIKWSHAFKKQDNKHKNRINETTRAIQKKKVL